MGGFKEHAGAGIFAFFIALVLIGVWYYYLFGDDFQEIYQHLWQIPICFVICYLAALFPDIDIKSKSQQVIYSILLIGDLVLITFRYFETSAWIGVGVLVVALMPHRGLTHKALTALIIPLPLLIIPILLTGDLREVGVAYYISAVVGYISHLWVDNR